MNGKKYPLRSYQIDQFLTILKTVEKLENEGQTRIKADQIRAEMNGNKDSFSWGALWELVGIGYLVHGKHRYVNKNQIPVYLHSWRTGKRKNRTVKDFEVAVEKYKAAMKERDENGETT